MAIIDVTATGVLATSPFKTAGGAVVDATFQPVGLTWFTFLGPVAAKIATNQTHVRITSTFPDQYAYILKELHVSIRLTLGVTHNFNQYGLIRFQNAYPESPSGRYQDLQIKNQGIAGEFGGASATDPVRAWDLVMPFRQLLQAPPALTMVMIIMLGDEDAGATNVGEVSFSACFYRYGIEQALSSALNAPQPTIAL